MIFFENFTKSLNISSFGVLEFLFIQFAPFEKNNSNCLMLQAMNSKSKKIHNFSIYEKTVNHKTTQKVPFSRFKGPLQMSNWHSLHYYHQSFLLVNWQFIWTITWISIAWTLDPLPPQKKIVMYIYNYSNGHSLDTGPCPQNKKICYVNLHIVTHLCQSMSQNSKIWGQKTNSEYFYISKIGTFWPSKWLIGDIFKNPNQGM